MRRTLSYREEEAFEKSDSAVSPVIGGMLVVTIIIAAGISGFTSGPSEGGNWGVPALTMDEKLRIW